MRAAVGFPDLHPGKGSPVGVTFLTEQVVYPHLIGDDIGCGMALFNSDLSRRKARLDQWADLPFDLENAWDGDVRDYLPEHGLRTTAFDESLGTVGGGNHFAELQAVEKIHDAGAFARTGLEADALAGLVHSGSRGLGERIWDGCHNSITRVTDAGENRWLRRIGSAPADGSLAVIPGSRGTLTYLVPPLMCHESHAGLSCTVPVANGRAAIHGNAFGNVSA